MFCSKSSSTLALILCLYLMISITTVDGCGQLPSGGTSLRFNVTGFTIPAVMAFTTEVNVPSQVPSISRDEPAAKAFVQNLITRSVEDVLQQQGRSALLSDTVISVILQQLTVNIIYTPIRCNTVFTSAMPGGQLAVFVMDKLHNCFIINDIVRNICERAGNGDCMPTDIKDVPTNHRVILGSLTTTNIIMASWSIEIWQNVLNRVMRTLASSPFGTNFSGATLTIIG